MADIQSISVGLTLDTQNLERTAQKAREILDQRFPPNLRRTLTLSANVIEVQGEAVTKAVRDLQKLIQPALQEAMKLTPTFTVDKELVKNSLKKDIEDNLKDVTIGIKSAEVDKNLAANIKNQIGVIDLEFDWHWKNGPPPDGGGNIVAAPTGKHGPSGGGNAAPQAQQAVETPATTGPKRRGSKVVQPTAVHTMGATTTVSTASEANKAAVEEAAEAQRQQQQERVQQQQAQRSTQHVRQARQHVTAQTARSRVPKDTGAAAVAPVIETAAPTGYQPPAGATIVPEYRPTERITIGNVNERPPRLSEEGERNIGKAPSWSQYLRSVGLTEGPTAELALKRGEQDRGIRGGGIRLRTPEEYATFTSPAAMALRNEGSRKFEEERQKAMAALRESINKGVRKPPGDISQADWNMMLFRHKREQQLFSALDAAKPNELGIRDFSALAKLGPEGAHLADAYESMSLGDFQDAARVAGSFRNAYLSGAGDEKTLKKRRRKLARSSAESFKAETADPILTLLQGTAAALGALTPGELQTVEGVPFIDPFNALKLAANKTTGRAGRPARDVGRRVTNKRTGEVNYVVDARDDAAKYLEMLRKYKSNVMGQSYPKGDNFQELEYAEPEDLIGMASGGPVERGLLERMLAQTLDGGRIKPGMEARSAELNKLIEMKRGGWQGRAGGGPADKFKITYRDVPNPGMGTFTRRYEAKFGEQLAGAVEVYHDRDRRPVDIYPYTEPEFRGQGVASALYKHIAKQGIPIEEISNENAAVGSQTGPGHAFWRARKRAQGWTDEKIESFLNQAGSPKMLGDIVDNSDLFEGLDPKYLHAGMAGGGIVERHSRLMKLTTQARDRSNRRWGRSNDLLGMDYGPETPERQASDRLGMQADALYEKLFNATREVGTEVERKIRSGEIVPPWARRAFGGMSTRGLYRVGELGPEYFQSNSGRNDQWLGIGGEHIWAAPEDGNIVPNYQIPPSVRAMLPHRAAGGRVDVRGPGGKFIRPEDATGFVRGYGEIQRVYVVNTPLQVALMGAVGGAYARMDEDTAASGATGAPFTKARRAATTQPQGRIGRASIESIYAAADEFENMRNQLTAVRSQITERYQAAPARAITTAFEQIAMNIAGRRGILARGRVAERYAGEAQTALGQAQGFRAQEMEARQQLADLNTNPEASDEDKAAAAALIKTLAGRRRRAQRRFEEKNIAANIAQGGLEETIREQQTLAGPSQREQEQARARVVRIGESIKGAPLAGGGTLGLGGMTPPRVLASTLAVGTVSSLLGGFALGLGFQAVNVAFTALGEVAGRAADQLTGFASTAAKVTTQLAEAARGQPGYGAEAITRQLGLLGVSPAQLTRYGPAAQQGQIVAGLQNMLQLTDIRRAADFYNANGGMNGRVRGLGGDVGNGLFPGTIFSFINQTPSAREQMLGELGRYAPGEPRPSAVLQEWQRRRAAGITNQGYQESYNDIYNELRNAGAKSPGGIGYLTEQNAAAQRGLASTGMAGLANLQFDANGALSVAGDVTIKAFSDAGAKDLGEAIVKQGFVLNGPNGGAPNAATANAWMLAVTQGANIPNAQTLLQGALPQLRMQQAGNFLMSQFQQERTLPLAFGWQQFLNRPLTPGIGIPGGATTPEAQAAFQRLGQLAAPGQAMIRAEVDPVTYQHLDDLASRIHDIQEQRIKIQVDFEEEQFNYQFSLAKRTAEDMVGLEGKISDSVKGQTATASEYGKLQRAQLMDARKLNDIQLERSQREINLNRALSELSVAGESPGERAQRLAYGRAQANEAQQIQDINVRTNRRGKIIQDIELSRNAQDALNSLYFLDKQHTIQIDTRKLDEVQGLLQAEQGYYEAIGKLQTDTITANMQSEKQLMIETSTAAGTWVDELKDAGTQLQNNAQWLDYIRGVGPRPAGTPGSNGYNSGFVGQPWHASGVAGMTTGLTNLGYAGEAGSELYMVLRNPRPIDMGYRGNLGGGGYSQINININNPVVRDDSDIDKLARRVEQVMNRRAASIGLNA